MLALKRMLRACGVPCAAVGLLAWGCAGTAVKPAYQTATAPAATPSAAAEPAAGPPPVTVDIGDHCLSYRYASSDRCNENDVADCEEATSDGDCGIPGDFVFTNAYCEEGSGLLDNHVICQGYIASGPLPQPQCPDGHVIGAWVEGQCEIGTCTDHCDDRCIGGYCSGSAYTLCYWQYAPSCDCGTVTCPCTGPDCDG